MKLGIILVLVGTSIWLIGCSKGSDDNSGAQPDKQGVDMPALEGKWNGADCQKWGEGEFVGSNRQSLNIVGSSLTSEFNSYQGDSCSGDLRSTMKMKMKFEVSKSNETTEWYNIDVVPSQITSIVYDQDSADIYNTSAFCGYTDWVVGVEKDIGGGSCISGYKQGTTIYSIIKVANTEIQLGNADEQNDGSSPEKRHKILSGIYKK